MKDTLLSRTHHLGFRQRKCLGRFFSVARFDTARSSTART